MQAMRDAGFVDRDTIKVERYPGQLLMLGQIGCKGQIVLTVEKTLNVLNEEVDALIQTDTYSYHAAIRNGHNILRYDNQHSWHGHVDKHHKHVFDLKTGDQIDGSPFWVGVDKWPTLGQVLRELMDWHQENYASLANPEQYSEPEIQTQRLSLGF
jgi:hypothetical protein